MEDVKITIAKNISELRVAAGMTQLELAEKLHYSDKAVSKWERAESVPDITTLTLIAEVFGVSLDFLVCGISDNKGQTADGNTETDEISDDGGEESASDLLRKKRKKTNHTVITLMSVLLVWFIAAFVYVLIDLISVDMHYHWLAFIYAVPISAIVWLVLNSIWFSRQLNYFIVSLLSWSLLVSIHLSLLPAGINIGLIYVLGVPAQLIIILSSKIRFTKRLEAQPSDS